MKRFFIAILAIVLCLAFMTGCNQKKVETVTGKGSLLDINTIETVSNPTVADDYATRDPEVGETVAIIHTNFGDIKMRFLDKIAPLATSNFIALAEAGKYDNTIFHRVINDFMIQGGDYENSDGTGGTSAYGIEFKNEVSSYASNVRGSVAMANAGPDTNGSQFYINQNHKHNAYLDGGYTVFGWVYEGMDVVDKIASVKTVANDKPANDVIITKVEIVKFDGKFTDSTADNGGNTMNFEAKPTDKLLDIGSIKTVSDPVVDDDYATRGPEKGETIAIIRTNYGDIKMRLLDEIAPLATNNFIALAEAGRYDNTIFHRVISDFMIQCGDYTNFNGTGGGSAYGVEFANEVSEYASNVRGSVAMANRGPDTNGSQFYINQNPTGNAYLDGSYTVFGWVYEGMTNVDTIANVPTDYSDRPIEDAIIYSIEIEEFKG